jgi:hypothetical protein
MIAGGTIAGERIRAGQACHQRGGLFYVYRPSECGGLTVVLFTARVDFELGEPIEVNYASNSLHQATCKLR